MNAHAPDDELLETGALDEEATDPRLPLGAAVAALLLVAVGGAVDLALDSPAERRSGHVLFELLLMGVSLGLAGYLWRSWWVATRRLRDARRGMAERETALRAERDAWRESAGAALEGMNRAIDRQFDLWKLTPAEREVALLLLEGHGHKQVAARTGRSERTVRQHAVAVYGKSGLGGRAELAAFFLEGLTRRAAPGATPGSG
jgi:DNA-binding CsgD family transcriptional regulator